MDRYNKGHLVGQGAFASVYEGTDTLLGRKVAIKVFHSHLSQNSAWAEHIIKEARIAASVSHTGILGVYDVLSAPEPALVLEWVDGNTLDFYLNQNGPMSTLPWILFATECLQALNAAHKAGILHRDIKPSNILLTSDGHIKLADFGLAASIHSAEQSLAGFKGTPTFAAPEILSGENYSPESDLFSMGSVLYMALCSKTPFAGEHLQALVKSIVEKDPALPSTQCAYLLPSIDDLCMQLLAKNFTKRITVDKALEILAKLKRDWMLQDFKTNQNIKEDKNWISLWIHHPRELVALEKTQLLSAIQTQKNSNPTPSASTLARLNYLANLLGSHTNSFENKSAKIIAPPTKTTFLRPGISVGILFLCLVGLLGGLMYMYKPTNKTTHTKDPTIAAPLNTHKKVDTVFLTQSNTPNKTNTAPDSVLSDKNNGPSSASTQSTNPVPKQVLNTQKNRTLSATKVDSSGFLTVLTKPPFATIWANGIERGQSPLKALRLQSGEYRILLSKKGFQPYSQTLQILAKDTLELNTELNPLEP